MCKGDAANHRPTSGSLPPRLYSSCTQKHTGTTMTTSDSNSNRQGDFTLTRGDRNTCTCTNTQVHTHLPCEGVQRKRRSWAVAGWGAHIAPRCPSGPRTPCHILEECCHCWNTYEGGTGGEREGVRSFKVTTLHSDKKNWCLDWEAAFSNFKCFHAQDT